MSRSVLRVAWYRFRATFAVRWGGLLAIVLLIGLVGGLAMGAVAGGAAHAVVVSRRSWRARIPPICVVLHNDSANDSNQSDPAFLRTLARLPHVKRVESTTGAERARAGPERRTRRRTRPTASSTHRRRSSPTSTASSTTRIARRDRRADWPTRAAPTRWS